MFNLKMISNINYSTPENAWILNSVNIDDDVREKMIEINECLAKQQPLSNDQILFTESQDYAMAQHECDLVSGRYYKMLNRFAISLAVKKGLIEDGNFAMCEDRDYVIRPPEYVEQTELFILEDKQGECFYVRLAEVEDHANKAMNNG